MLYFQKDVQGVKEIVLVYKTMQERCGLHIGIVQIFASGTCLLELRNRTEHQGHRGELGEAAAGRGQGDGHQETPVPTGVKGFGDQEFKTLF